jgi:hypothetical protein
MISKKEIADLTVRSGEDSVEGDEPGDDSRNEEKYEEAELIVLS